MITKIRDGSEMSYLVQCDKCSFNEEVEAWDWQELLEEMKGKEWKSIKNEELDEWDNICPFCQRKGGIG